MLAGASSCLVFSHKRAQRLEPHCSLRPLSPRPPRVCAALHIVRLYALANPSLTSCIGDPSRHSTHTDSTGLSIVWSLCPRLYAAPILRACIGWFPLCYCLVSLQYFPDVSLSLGSYLNMSLNMSQAVFCIEHAFSVHARPHWAHGDRHINVWIYGCPIAGFHRMVCCDWLSSRVHRQCCPCTGWANPSVWRVGLWGVYPAL